MLNKLIQILKELSLSDKYLLGVSLLIIMNPRFAVLIAGVVFGYFAYTIGKRLVQEVKKT